MGGGKRGHHCQLIGFGYTLTMLYAFCERADKVSGWKVNDRVWWIDNDLLTNNDTYQTYQQNLYTGKKGTVYSSEGSDHTNITFYLKDYDPVPYPQNTIGYDIKLNNIVFAYMPDAFVGDNTTTVPRYNARLSRFIIDGKNHKIGKGSVNPVAVIREILHDFLQINQIDEESFQTAYNICQQEGLGVSFIMTTEKKVKDWLQEILRVIDGILWFDTLTGKWKIKLFRPDTSTDTVYEISEANASKIEIESGSWDNLVNEFTFKYTNILTGKTESFTLENSALFNILGYKISKTYTYQLIGEYEIMAKVANRVIKKNSKPLSKVKARVSILDLPYIELGNVVKVSSAKLDIEDKYFRITKIGGDKEDDVYVDIEGVEDVWEVDYTGAIISNPLNPINSKIYEIKNIKPYIVSIKEFPRFFVSIFRGTDQPIGGIVTYPQNYKYQYVLTGAHLKYQTDLTLATMNKTQTKLYYYGRLQSDFTFTDFRVNPNQSITIKPYANDSYCQFPSLTQTEAEWQTLHWLLLIDDEFFGIKDIVTIDEQKHIYQIKGIIRLMDKRFWKNHSANTPVYLVQIDDINDIYHFNVSNPNDTKVQLTATLFNYVTQGKPKTDNKPITGIARKLIPPYHHYVYTIDVKNKDGNWVSRDYLTFSKTARGLNTHATFENIEHITAGEKEEVSEATHIRVKWEAAIRIFDKKTGELIKTQPIMMESDISLTQENKKITVGDTSVIEYWDEGGIVTVYLPNDVPPFIDQPPSYAKDKNPDIYYLNRWTIRQIKFVYMKDWKIILESEYLNVIRK